jgi:hypothetical protein
MCIFDVDVDGDADADVGNDGHINFLKRENKP